MLHPGPPWGLLSLPTFTERFAGWPVKVRQLSRLVGAREAAETRAGLKDGSVEIVLLAAPASQTGQ